MKSIKVDFTPLIKKLDLLANRFVESDYMGERYSQEKRKGIEFEDYKLFQSGDDASLIDWKASLRTGEMMLRQYTQLKTMNIFVIVDVSNSMLFSSISKLKCEFAAELAASLSHFFLQSDDMVGFAMFNNRVAKLIPPNFGQNHFRNIAKFLSEPSIYGGDFNLSQSVFELQPNIPRGSEVIIISDFLGLEGEWEKSLQAMSANAEVIALIVRDPEDLHLSSKVGHAVLSDPYSDDILFVNMDRARQDYDSAAREQLRDVQRKLKHSNIDSLLLETDKSFVDPLFRFFAQRKRRWQ